MRSLHSVRLAVVAFAVLIPATAWAQQSRSAAPDADPRQRGDLHRGTTHVEASNDSQDAQPPHWCNRSAMRR